MKAATRLFACVLVGMFAASALGQIEPGVPGSYPSVAVKETPHNLNNYPAVTGTIPGNQVCLPCHTPHNAYPDPDGQIHQVLWNHEETDVSFTMYTTLSGQTGSGPDGPSKMCLSCHDGVTAVDNYGNPWTGELVGGTTVMTGPRAIGRDANLTDDHPIGIQYPADRPAEYRAETSFDPGINSGPGVRLVTIDGVKRVECTSCHDPHNNGLGRFLRVPIQESYICLQCHIK